jgi:hypothetical protein
MVNELNLSVDILQVRQMHQNLYICRQAFLAIALRDIELILQKEGFSQPVEPVCRLGDLLVHDDVLNRSDLEPVIGTARLKI